MRYEAPRGQRIKGHGFCGIQLRRDDKGESLWWDGFAWVSLELGQTNTAPCRTVRAFRRHLRKNPEMRGRLVLGSRFIGHDVYG